MTDHIDRRPTEPSPLVAADGGDPTVDAFVHLAEALIGDYDVVDFVHDLLVRCLPLVAADAGGVLLHHEGELRVLASSDESAESLEAFELQNEEGPCFDAFTRGELVSAWLDDTDTRWPRFTAVALGAGWKWVLGVPMRVRGTTVGAMNLFGRSASGIDERAARLVEGLANVAAVGILQNRALDGSETTIAQLEGALQSRVVIEQAKGRISEQTGRGMGESFALLRTHARSRNMRLSEVARAVAEGHLDASSLDRGSGAEDH